MKKAGCNDLEAFRKLPADQLFAAWQSCKKETKGSGMIASPCIDGRLVVSAGTDILAAGDHHQIPYMAGSTSEDVMPPMIYAMSRSWCAAQQKKSFAWFFDRRLPGDENGAWHSSDLWYWFGTLENCWRPMEHKDQHLSEQMVGYLCNFVKTGDPNGIGLPKWTPCDGKNVLCLGQQEPEMKKPPMGKMLVTMLTNKAVGE
jgi:para-nitrobenzyl esterase